MYCEVCYFLKSVSAIDRRKSHRCPRAHPGQSFQYLVDPFDQDVMTRKPICRFEQTHLVNQLFRRRRPLIRNRIKPSLIAGQLLRHNTHQLVPIKRWSTREHMPSSCPQRVDVGSLIDILPQKLLRSDIERRPKSATFTNGIPAGIA